MRQLFVLLASAFVLAPAAFAAGSAHDSEEAGPIIAFGSSEPGGVRTFNVSQPAGFGTVSLQVSGVLTYDYAPWHIELIRPDGSVYVFFDRTGLTFDGDLASWGEGDGVVYAGGPGGTVESPDVENWGQPYTNTWSETVDGTSGKLVVAWANQESPISFELRWRPGTAIVPGAVGGVEAFEMKDFEEGARAGVPALVVAHAGDALTLQPVGSQLWGYFYVYRSTALGAGKLVVERQADGLHRELSFDELPETCVCYETYRWVFTSDSEMRATLDMVADGRRSGVFALVGALPSGSLGTNVWQEFHRGTGT